ncbi:hypothetical protein OUZ56_032563 [Daphnia magna]|uniref:Uncharacterized protein n=1 Tax=Daphnia magna TaxID=35525 RepID=A0ABR0B998_9CRUS|nr:hypothetical protein OUZ56_032563 [Daphnia magna]
MSPAKVMLCFASSTARSVRTDLLGGRGECKCRLAVEFEEDVPFRARDDPFRAEAVPAPLGTVANDEIVAVEADGNNKLFACCCAESDPGLAEGGPVAGEPAGDDDVFADAAVETANELAAVHLEAFGEDEDPAELPTADRRRDELLPEGGADAEGLFRSGNGRRREGELGACEAGDGDRQRSVPDGSAMDFAGA